jgi:hypothetical protein
LLSIAPYDDREVFYVLPHERSESGVSLPHGGRKMLKYYHMQERIPIAGVLTYTNSAREEKIKNRLREEKNHFFKRKNSHAR